MSHKNLNPATAGKLKRVAIVISNPGVSTTTGWPVGFWWAELSTRTSSSPRPAMRSSSSAHRAAPAGPTP